MTTSLLTGTNILLLTKELCFCGRQLLSDHPPCSSVTSSRQTTKWQLSEYTDWHKASRNQRGADIRKKASALGSNHKIVFNGFCPRTCPPQIEIHNPRVEKSQDKGGQEPGIRPKCLHIKSTQISSWPLTYTQIG